MLYSVLYLSLRGPEPFQQCPKGVDEMWRSIILSPLLDKELHSLQGNSKVLRVTRKDQKTMAKRTDTDTMSGIRNYILWRVKPPGLGRVLHR